MKNNEGFQNKGDILIVDDELSSLRTLSDLLTADGYRVRGAPDASTALMIVENEPPELIILDVRMPGMDGFEVCRQIKANEKTSDLPVLFLSALDETAPKVKGFSAGGVDFITKPFQAEEVMARVETHVTLNRLSRNLEQQVERRTKKLKEAFKEIEALKYQLEQENIYLRQEIDLQHQHDEIIGQSNEVRQMLGRAEQVANTDSTVLILGETGTGKELLARAIHRMSARSNRAMVTVNCAALPATLIESEMFGREKGAFTGALSGRIGRFEVADGSTIFLDEIGELTGDMQMKLLRVLETGHFERLGSNKTIKVDVRIIAATNRDLVKAVHDGSFRRDLFYRLNVFPINVPSLQDRIEDLELLVWAFVKQYAERMGKRIETIPKKRFEALKKYPWNGNIRELRNVIEQSMIITKGSTLEVQLPGIHAQNGNQAVLLKDVERNHILKILKQTGWRVRGNDGAAKIMGLKESTLRFRMKKLGIQRPGRNSGVK